MGIKNFRDELLRINEAVEIGGFRQWIEEGRSLKARYLVDILTFCRASNPPKSIKIISRVLKEIHKQKLDTKEVTQNQAITCGICGGHKKLDDDVSDCPACNGQGVVWTGELTKHYEWLEAASAAYLKLSPSTREEEIKNWLNENKKLIEENL